MNAVERFLAAVVVICLVALAALVTLAFWGIWDSFRPRPACAQWTTVQQPVVIGGMVYTMPAQVCARHTGAAK